MNPLDISIRVTLFPDLEARFRESRITTLREFANDALLHARAATKAGLRLASFCSYGEKHTAAGSLRHDANIVECFAVVADYDGEKVSLAEAHAAIVRAGVAGVLVTSPSYTVSAPRWRFIAPLAVPLNRHTIGDFPKLASRLAGIFPEPLDAASWRASQSWYVGTVDGASDHGVLLL
jgi:hypothetical protein